MEQTKAKLFWFRIDQRRRKLIGACMGCAGTRRLRFENVVSWVADYLVTLPMLTAHAARTIQSAQRTHQSMIRSEKNWHDIYKMLSRVFHALVKTGERRKLVRRFVDEHFQHVAMILRKTYFFGGTTKGYAFRFQRRTWYTIHQNFNVLSGIVCVHHLSTHVYK